MVILAPVDSILDLDALNAEDYRNKYQDYPMLRHPHYDCIADTLFYALENRHYKHIPFLLETEPFNLAKYIYVARSDLIVCNVLQHFSNVDVNSTYEGLTALQHALCKNFKKSVTLLCLSGALYQIYKEKKKETFRPPPPIPECDFSICAHRYAFDYLFGTYDPSNVTETVSELSECFFLTENHMLKLRIISIRDDFGNNILHLNLAQKNFRIVEALIAFEPKLLSEKNNDEQTPGFMCQNAEHAEFLNNNLHGSHRILDDGFNTCRIWWDKLHIRRLRETDDDLWLPEKIYLQSTFLHAYLSNMLRKMPHEIYSFELYKLVELLVTNDCSMIPDVCEIRDTNLNTLLHVAVDQNSQYTIPLIEKFPQLLHTKNRQLMIPLHYCHNQDHAKYMIEKGIHFELKDMYGCQYNLPGKVASLQCLSALMVHSRAPELPLHLKDWVMFHSTVSLRCKISNLLYHHIH